MIEPKVFSVGQINRYIKNLLENDFILNSLLVQGEISNFKAHSSGHWYFTLKDAQGAIACVMFQQDAAQVPFLPENGMQVILYGHVSLYERTGQYQLYGEFLEPVGMGALQLAFEQMKETKKKFKKQINGSATSCTSKLGHYGGIQQPYQKWRVFMVLLQYKRIFHSNSRRMLL